MFDRDRLRHRAGLQPLIKLLKEVARTIERYAVVPAAGRMRPRSGRNRRRDDAGGAAGRSAAPAGEAGDSGALHGVTSRATRCGCSTWCAIIIERYEPSSPLPMLIERARGWRR